MFSESNVLVPPEILAESPSKKDGVNEEVEAMHRVFGCEVLQEGGILLSLPQAVVVTGQNLLQRMFFRCACACNCYQLIVTVS
jgi:cyclin L